jgi:hypothetical protein
MVELRPTGLGYELFQVGPVPPGQVTPGEAPGEHPPCVRQEVLPALDPQALRVEPTPRLDGPLPPQPVVGHDHLYRQSVDQIAQTPLEDRPGQDVHPEPSERAHRPTATWRPFQLTWPFPKVRPTERPQRPRNAASGSGYASPSPRPNLPIRRSSHSTCSPYAT